MCVADRRVLAGEERTHRATALRVTQTASLIGARIGCWFGPDGDGGLGLSEFRHDFPTVTSEGVRPSWGSGHPNGALLVASGRLDLFVLVGGGPWDHAAPAVIVEEAGGRFSDLSGQPRIDTGVGLFSNARLHDAASEMLNRQ